MVRPKIRYCFKDLKTKSQIGPFFPDAINLWNDGGANIDFINEGGDGICPTDGLRDLLVVSVGPEAGFRTTVGFNGNDQHMILGGETHKHTSPPDLYHRKWIYGIAHELGHAIGFRHEHQKPYADRFLTINCENLADYDKARKEQKKNKEKLSKACTDQNTAAEIEFWGAANFLPFKDVSEFVEQDRKEGEDELDWDSIMMYGSTQGGKRPFGRWGPKATVMTLKEGVGGPDRIKEIHERPPSERDIRAVKHMYDGNQLRWE